MSQSSDIDSLKVSELKVLELLARATEQERTIAVLRDEILRLKSGPGLRTVRPTLSRAAWTR
jgi:uncharacterized small protein (DUF1192 family)